MKENLWMDAWPRCPYYLRHGAGRIVCRGYGGAQRVAIEFDRPRELLAHYEAYCRAGQRGCPQRRTIENLRRGS